MSFDDGCMWKSVCGIVCASGCWLGSMGNVDQSSLCRAMPSINQGGQSPYQQNKESNA